MGVADWIGFALVMMGFVGIPLMGYDDSRKKDPLALRVALIVIGLVLAAGW